VPLESEVALTDRGRRRFDLIVIGSGLAGTAAACFAVSRGLKTAQVSATGGELAFASGLLDLLGIYPAAEQRPWDHPWTGLATLISDSPQHPYARLGIDAIREAMQELLAFAHAAGLPYCGLPDRNVTLPTATGTLKTTSAFLNQCGEVC
jgi:glycerol-3-phosphate dehydrogenase subunit B